ncbi:MAG TPA: hypothetical protein VHP35_14715 [Terriglobia bacterium]|nr:hypothetical protein [Terriglobia bacterium]
MQPRIVSDEVQILTDMAMLQRCAAGLVFLWLVLAHSVAVSAESTSLPRFAWRKDSSRGDLESYGVELGGNGRGQVQFKKRNEESITLEVALKPAAIDNLASLFTRADFLNEAKDFVSPRKVADMGAKTVRYDTGLQKREVVYNYTEDKTLQEITNFFENLCQQERALFEMDLALKYDRLGIPKKLDELERNLSAKRIVAPERFTQVLEKIYQDESLMHLARKEAKKILSRIEKMQAFPN